jgi:exopolyphosphatase/guanosine-5'-triphosphate,3'-diphosphate pyrophosphatase
MHPANPGSGIPGPDTSRLAAIDIGSNSIHMMIVETDGRGGHRTLDREREMVRLGRSALGPSGRLSERAVRQGLDALLRMTTLARLRGVERFVAVATSAVREAANGEEFLEQVRARAGLDVRLLSGEEEARLIWRAVREAVDLSRGTHAIVDIGGGSTEWIVASDDRIVEARSLPLGSLRCAHLLPSDPPTPGELGRLGRRIARELRALADPGSVGRGGARGAGRAIGRLVATSGTANCCADLHAWFEGRNGRGPGAGLRELRWRDLDRVVARLRPLSRRQIAALPPVGEGRAASLLPGALLLAAVARHAGVERLTVSDRALREGLVLEELGAPAPEAARGDVRRRQVLSLLERTGGAMAAHGDKAAELAGRLFDATGALHDLGGREREWLEHAARLHDIGHSIHYRGHHKHSQYLIETAALDGFDEREIEVIAQVARYHRGSRPRLDHPAFAALRPWQRRAVVRLAALLRVADALDRTHAGRVEDVRIEIRRRRVRLEVVSASDVGIEIETVRERRALFEETFGRRLELRQAPPDPPPADDRKLRRDKHLPGGAGSAVEKPPRRR